jgi:hypothetical protein
VLATSNYPISNFAFTYTYNTAVVVTAPSSTGTPVPQQGNYNISYTDVDTPGSTTRTVTVTGFAKAGQYTTSFTAFLPSFMIATTAAPGTYANAFPSIAVTLWKGPTGQSYEPTVVGYTDPRNLGVTGNTVYPTGEIIVIAPPTTASLPPATTSIRAPVTTSVRAPVTTAVGTTSVLGSVLCPLTFGATVALFNQSVFIKGLSEKLKVPVSRFAVYSVAQIATTSTPVVSVVVKIYDSYSHSDPTSAYLCNGTQALYAPPKTSGGAHEDDTPSQADNGSDAAVTGTIAGAGSAGIIAGVVVAVVAVAIVVAAVVIFRRARINKYRIGDNVTPRQTVEIAMTNVSEPAAAGGV